MKKCILLLVIVLTLHVPSVMLADECMDGDCDNGVGTGFTDDGKVYEGEWKNGLPHGKGKLYIKKGKVIEGIWEKGELVEQKDAEVEKK